MMTSPPRQPGLGFLDAGIIYASRTKSSHGSLDLPRDKSITMNVLCVLWSRVSTVIGDE